MLTRLKVNGFKNLNEVDVWFGPFTCVAGANGVGKSNLFDAITFLRLLASQPLLEAATSIRDEDAKAGDVRSLFFRTPDGHRDTMRLEAEMIVPKVAVDRRSRQAMATSTFLRYELELRYRGEHADEGPLEILFEQLSYITKGDAPRSLPFEHSPSHWRDSWLVTKSKAGPFITTKAERGDSGQVAVELRQDQNAGRPQLFTASALQRTVLSDVNATEAPTVVVARHEMMNWQLLQFEPSALRAHDSVRAPRAVGANGAHMPAALQHLIRRGGRAGSDGSTPTVPDVSAEIARRVSELVDDVRDVWVDEDPRRELLTLNARLADASEHPARSLSDGTLRFLALAIIEQTPQSGGLYCLEEPENGVHPERIPSMLKLLADIATDPEEPVEDADNPLRQVIINTHSPAIVQQVPDESLVVAERVPRRVGDRTVVNGLRFSALPNTWRTRPAAGMAECPMGKLLSYLNPVTLSPPDDGRPDPVAGKRRVIDRADVRQYSLFGQSPHE